MYREILINVEAEEKRVAIVEDKKLEEFYVERQGTQKPVGNIYKGVVDSLVPAIGAAFINIGLAKNGFLYVQDLTQPDYEKIAEIIDRPDNQESSPKDKPHTQRRVNIKDVFKVGQQILVQVVKEPLGTKGARLTTHISMPGRYLVLLPCDKHKGISRRIKEPKERARLRGIMQSLNMPRDLGLIVRTASFGSTKKEFIQDIRYLTNLWRKIKLSAQKSKSPALVHEEYDLVLRIIRDNFTSQTNKLLVDSKEEYRRIIRFLNIFSPGLRSRVQFYRDHLPIFEKKAVEEEINRIYDRKVLLRSGGHLMIEPTESLVAIDVNSGKFTGRRDPEETAYLVNLEAAKEIARQIRLRDLGGIIIIDFIDMRLPKHRQRVFDALNEALHRDHAKTDISAVSQLGLVEMTRQRIRKSLESVAYRPCTYCQGKGLVKSPATMAILALRRISKVLQRNKKRTVLLFAHPEVSSQLVNDNRRSIFNLEHRFRAKILIKADSRLHMEELKIETA